MHAEPVTMPGPAGAAGAPADDGIPGPRSRRTAAKRRVIAQAAAAVFLREGYVSASMDEVAAVAGVSKQTVYKHFGNKEQLFLAVIHQAINGVLEEFLAVLATSFPDSENPGDLEGDLLRLGRILLTKVMDPALMAVRRLVIAEAVRFPQLGRAWYETGPGRLAAELSDSLDRLAGRGQLAIDDPLAAASDFNWLVVSKPQNMALFGMIEGLSPAQIDQYVASAVKVFLAAYQPQATARPGGASPPKPGTR